MATDQQFCLRWNNHQSTLISVFDTLLENGTLVDCTLAAEGQYLKAHKVVLSACSPYLEALLSQHYEKHPIVILKDVKFTELKSMMDYMYRGEVNISQDQLGTFLKAAESLQIKGLSDNGDDARDVGSTTKTSTTTRPAVTEVRNNAETKRPAPAVDSDASRDGSISPSSLRKRRRTRRTSQGEDHDGLDASNCDLPNQAQSTPLPVPSTTIVPTPISKTIVKQEPISRLENSVPPESGLLKEKIEPPSEPLLEPKTEYLDYMNSENSIEVEDLTLDDDEEELDSSMDASRPGPSHGDMSNQGYPPWNMTGDQSGTDEIFMAAQQAVGAAAGQQRDSQDGDSQDKENPEIIDLREETPEVKVEVQEDSTKADPLSEDPLRISKESEELTSKGYKIYNERREEMIIPEIVDDSSIGCGENLQSSYLRLIHPDQLMELTSPLKANKQTSEGDTQTDTSVVIKGSTPQSSNNSGNLFSRPKSAEMPGSFRVIEINTTSENCQSISHMKQYNSRSISAPVKKALSGTVDAVASKFRKIMPKVKQTQTADANVQNNENKVTIPNQPATITTDVRTITTTANTQNIPAGQFLPFATTTVSSSSQQISHNLGLPVQISTGAVTHSASGVLQPQWIVSSQPQPTIVLNQPSPSFAIPQPVLVAPTIIPHSDTTQHKDMCYIKTPQGYIKKIETPAMKPAISEPSENLNKVPIPRYYVSRLDVPTQTQGTLRGSRGRGSRGGGIRSFKSVWQNRLLAQHTINRPITPEDVQRIRLSRENAEFSKINKNL